MNIETNGTYVKISETILNPQELAELVAVVSYMLWKNNRNKRMGKFGKNEPRPENEFGTGPVEEYLHHIEKHSNKTNGEYIKPISINIESLIKEMNIQTGSHSTKVNEELVEEVKKVMLNAFGKYIADMSRAKNDL